MQLQLLVEQALKADKSYQQLKNQLFFKQEKCLKKAVDKQQIQQCLSTKLHFETYLSQYIYQYREKGRKICGEVIKRQSILSEKLKVKNECIVFYNKSIDIFMDNVKDKMRSLIYNIDFSQL